MAPISQREARRLQKRVADLERQIKGQRARWSADYVGGVEVYRITLDRSSHAPTAIRTARRVGHAVVALCDDQPSSEDVIRFIALPHPSESI
jgi:hypothetical protein